MSRTVDFQVAKGYMEQQLDEGGLAALRCSAEATGTEKTWIASLITCKVMVLQSRIQWG